MRGLRALLLIAIMAGTAQCKKAIPSQLAITPIPSTVFLITAQGANITCGGVTIAAPLFILESLNVDWLGTGQAWIFDIQLNSVNASDGIQCVIAGQGLDTLFSSSTTLPSKVVNSQVVFNQGDKAYQTTQICCGSLSPPKNSDGTYPTSFNIPVKIEVDGATFDTNGNPTGRITSTATITLN